MHVVCSLSLIRTLALAGQGMDDPRLGRRP